MQERQRADKVPTWNQSLQYSCHLKPTPVHTRAHRCTEYLAEEASGFGLLSSQMFNISVGEWILLGAGGKVTGQPLKIGNRQTAQTGFD